MIRQITFFMAITCYLGVGAQSWTQLSTIPGQGRDAANSFVIDGKIYLGGGSISGGGALNDFYEYDPSTNVWTAKANVPDYLGGSACFSLEGKGYIVSGQNNNAVVHTVYQYDPFLDQWNTMSSFPGPARLDCMGFAINDTGYLFGGYPGGTELNDLWAYNPGNDTWIQKTSMPSVGRSGPGGFVINGIAYIGLGEYHSSANYATDMFSYHPTTDTWDSMAQFPGLARNNPLGFSIGGLGYLGMGGYVNLVSGTDTLFTTFYQYNPISNTWAPSTSFSSQGRSNAVCEQIGDTVYVGAGIGSGSNYLVDWWRNADYTTGIENIDILKTSVYPNPLNTGSWTLVVSDDFLGGQLEITDGSGQKLYSSKVQCLKSQINTSLSSGIYLMRVSNAQRTSLIKLVKL